MVIPFEQLMNPTVPPAGVTVEFLKDAVALDTKSVVLALQSQSAKVPTILIKVTSDTPNTPLTDGKMMIEMAHEYDFEGNWAPLFEVDLTTVLVLGDEGLHQEDDMNWAYPFLRARVSEAITGGSASVLFVHSNM